MLCLSCRRATRGYLCSQCCRLLRPAPPRVVDGSIVVRSSFVHEGPARDMVHLLKYQGVRTAAVMLAAAMEPLLPAGSTALVPVPRAMLRRLKFGVDPAVELAIALGRRSGLPVVRAMVAPLASGHHAGRPRARRAEPVFILRTRVPSGAVIIDDVITTGSTFEAAIHCLSAPHLSGLSATAAPR